MKVFVTIVLILIVNVFAQDPSLLVNAPAGNFQGFYNPSGARVWKGIPFAKPPVGNLRFTAPQPMTKISGTYNANFNAPGCMQDLKRCPTDLGVGAYCPDQVSEDCLYLTVTAPSKPSNDPKGYAVMVWIFGGSFVAGHGSAYEVSSFAKDNIILITFNYRVNVYGFLATDTLKGNYGFLDQRMALQWVKDNIKSFGGDPSRVTIAGESAGAMAVSAHLASPGSQGLFRSIIMMSSPMAISFQNRSSIKSQVQLVYNYLGCNINDDNCVRQASTDQLNAAYVNTIADTQFALTPLVEYKGDIPQQPFVTMLLGNYDPAIAVYAGFTKEEGHSLIYSAVDHPLSKKETQEYYKKYLGADQYALYSPIINAFYPYDNSVTDGRDLITKILTDYLFACPLMRAAEFASISRQNIFIYEYTHAYTNDVDTGDSMLKNCKGRVCHGIDVPFVFSDFLGTKYSFNYQATPQETFLANTIHDMWVNFVITQNPNNGGAPIFTSPILPFNYQRLLTTLDIIPYSDIEPYSRDMQCQILWDISGLFGGYPQAISQSLVDISSYTNIY